MVAHGRYFEAESIRDEAGNRRSACVIRCGEPGCMAADSIRLKGRGIGPQMARRTFEHHGWTLGDKPEDDRCPQHKPTRRPKLNGSRKDDAVRTVTHLPGARPAQTEAPAAREPTREDRRRITETLDEHYEPEKGYRGDWSDQKIGKKLDVPHAWVRELRVLLYGDAAGNEATDEARHKLAELEGRCAALDTLIEQAMTGVSEVRSEIARLQRKLG
jgi:hypothetical protein